MNRSSSSSLLKILYLHRNSIFLNHLKHFHILHYYNYSNCCNVLTKSFRISSCSCSFSTRKDFPPPPPEIDNDTGTTSKSQSKLVQKNWDHYYENVRNRKKRKRNGTDGSNDGYDNLLSASNSQVVEDEADELESRRKEYLDVDPADQFGTLTIGEGESETRVAVNHSREIRKELDELETDIYSIDKPVEEDDVRIAASEREDKWSMRKLRIQTKVLLRQGKLPEALNQFMFAMKAGGFNYKVTDLDYMYTILIAECSRAGHVKMAFKLFRQMKDRGCKVKPNVYTSLFNAIANSVGDKKEKLVKLEGLKQSMIEKGFVPNIIHYHAMIKAFGRLEQIQSAFALVDEMIQKSDSNVKLRPTIETFSFLFQACISDKENGFRHSLVTWQKMIEMGFRPHKEFTFNLFLRSVRECEIVIPKSVRKYLGEQFHHTENVNQNYMMGIEDDKSLMVQDHHSETNENERTLLPPLVTSGLEFNCASILNDLSDKESDIASSNHNYQNYHSNSISFKSGDSDLINLLRNCKTSATSVQDILKFPENRLAILGGLRAIVSEMRRYNVRPDLKSLTELVQIVHPVDIPDLMHLLQEHRIKPDTDFFNLMIQKYLKWNLYRDAKRVLSLMTKYRLRPNVMTWGVFSASCKTWKDGKGLLLDMESCRMEPNIKIMGGLLAGAIASFHPRFVLRVMEELRLRNMVPDGKFVQNVMDFKAIVQKGVINWEKGFEATPFNLQKQLEENHEEFEHYWTKFKLRYDTWIKSIPEATLAQVKNPEPIDPWTDDYETRMRALKARQEFN